MGTVRTNTDGRIAVPRELLVATIKALRLGGDAVLDREWDCYSKSERLEAEQHAEETFTRVVQELERLLDS